MDAYGWTYKNITVQLDVEPDIPDIHVRKMYERKYRRYDTAFLHYAMFFAGAIAVSVFNKKKEIISYTKNTIAKIDVFAAMKIIIDNLKKTVISLYVAIFKYSTILWVTLNRIVHRIKDIKRGINTNVMEKHKRLNFILLKKLKEVCEERRKLGQLLIAALHENKNIRIQFQLENMAKNRLVRHIEDTQKKIKENRSKYVSFQHLYIVTHEENIFLKARIRKLSGEKENAEKDLMKIINEVYRSKNNELKVFCSRFIVRPNDNLLNNDVSAEIKKFLQKSCSSTRTASSWQFTSANDTEFKYESKMPHSANARVTEIFHDDDSLVPVVSDAPKLKGLPGECIWTVKDKDGIIEKLYEYDCESDFDNGDTIRRIREYSVYYDKDCLLDFSR